MADESPSEREERLQSAEERLQKQHSRLMEQPPKGGGGGAGKAFGNILGFMGDHKIIVFGAIGIAIVLFVLAKNRSSTSTGAVAQPGSLANAGYQDQGTAYALTQLGQQLNNLEATIANNPVTTVTSTAPTPPPPTTTTGGGYKQLPGGPLLAPGSYSGPSYSNLKPGTKWLDPFNKILYTLSTGGGGRLYGTPSGGQQVLLTEPTSAYPKAPQANHSPMYTGMSLTPLANHGVDLSNTHTASNPRFVERSVPTPAGRRTI